MEILDRPDYICYENLQDNLNYIILQDSTLLYYRLDKNLHLLRFLDEN